MASARADIPHNDIPKTDIRTWKVAGLRLGMSASQAISIAKSHRLIEKQKMNAGDPIYPEPKSTWRGSAQARPNLASVAQTP
jgi:hypothetical protein